MFFYFHSFEVVIFFPDLALEYVGSYSIFRTNYSILEHCAMGKIPRCAILHGKSSCQAHTDFEEATSAA